MNKYIYKTGLLFSFILFNSCSNGYTFEHLQTSDNLGIITRIEVNSFKTGNNTYFTLGEYNCKEIPESFIKPNYSGLTSGFELIINWENDTCTFNYYTGDFTISNPKQTFKVKKVTVQQFMVMKKDSTGAYLYQIEPAIF